LTEEKYDELLNFTDSDALTGVHPRCSVAMIDIFVLPSLWEGLPITILEAMARARPVVATDIPGNVEVVKNNINGLLVPPRNPKKLSEAITALLSDRDRARLMGEEGRKFIQHQYDAKTMAAKVQTLYFELLGKP